MRILLVEDNIQLARAIQPRLEAAGYVVDSVSSAGDAEAAARTVAYQLIVLDRRLPDGDGLLRIREFRASLPDVRIIVLTALDATSDKILGLDSGADDYLTKPFEIDELIARIRAAMRRPGGAPQPMIVCGDLSYDPSSREFAVKGHPIILKRREQLILEALVMRARRVVQRDSFMEQVYGFDDEVQSNTLDSHISRLRTRLTELGASVQIHPVRGVGYMLIEERLP